MTNPTETTNIQNLQSNDRKLRFQSALILAQSGNPIGNKVLCQAVAELAWNDVNLYEVIDVLGEVGDEDCVDTLVTFLANFRGHARGNALGALLKIGTENAVNAVFEELGTNSPWYGWGTAQLIADFGEKFLPNLLKSTQDSNALVRARSIYALGVIESSEQSKAIIEEVLINALKDVDSKVRERAAWGLAKRTSESAHEALLGVLDSGDVEASQWAAEGLYKAGIEPQKSLELLIHTLGHDDFLVRRSAVWALQRIKDSQAIPVLVNVLKTDDEPGIRYYAAKALGSFQHEDIVKYLQEGLNDESELVRSACIEALTELLNEGALPLFIPFQEDEHPTVRHTVHQIWEKYNFRPNLD